MAETQNLVSKLTDEEIKIKRYRLSSISPDDGKYGESSDKLANYLSEAAEWKACAFVQKILLETRKDFGVAEQRHVEEVNSAMEKIDVLNMALLEKKVTKHDQLAVIDEIGRHVSAETKALLHPGTTSYDILDTARSYLLRKAWNEVIKPEISRSITNLCDIAEKSKDMVQVGRTHLQDTSPITVGFMMAGYAGRLAERLEKTDRAFSQLRGKVSGIVGTGASIDMVIGDGTSIEFEREALKKLGLEPDYTATQIVQKEQLSDVGHGLTTLMHVLGDFANDIRMLYSSAIGEVTSRDNAARLGGSSADAMKNNPIDYENIAGNTAVVESGMRILYAMIPSDFQRDLRNSKQARYQPRIMMAETYESFERLNKVLNQLSINEDRLKDNLQGINENPSEAMTSILRGEGWVHSTYGVGHDFVKEMGKKAKKRRSPLLEVCLEDAEFETLYNSLPPLKKDILDGDIYKYIGSAKERIDLNESYARGIVRRLS